MIVFDKFTCSKKHKTQKKNWQRISYIFFLKLFDVLQNFPFTTSEMMGDYYLQT